MTPERWQQIEQIFHAALACGRTERADFLTNACVGNESLRVEVESLLSFHEQAQSFIETPPGDVAAEMLGAGNCRFEPGKQIDNYKIIRQLGSGGMSEVYLGRDIRLNRNIALKILPPEFTINADRVRRFQQEARAASALNHPNIVTIHEIGNSNSVHFIATEFIDGVTLRQHLADPNTTLAKVLDVAWQVAIALAAAHEAGIVHRDIKPENVMLRPDGLVKVLDFGLAKPSSDGLKIVGSQAPTQEVLKTDPGMVMGTVRYMSPEQARGERMDHRTDIWSLGVVLYEMLTGHVPFMGETSSHVIVSILEAEPVPMRRYVEIPAELERIIIKTLSKTKDGRYQTAADLALDLKNVRQKLEVEASLKRITPFDDDGRRKRSTASFGVSTANFIVVHWIKHFVVEIKHHQTLAVVALLLLLGASLAYFLVNRTKTLKRGTTNEEAYRLYLHGMNLAGNRSAEDAREAAEALQEAVKLDPNYAVAWAGLAYVYRPLGNGDSHEAYRKSTEAINNAITLDANLADSYSFLCENKMYYEYDFGGAEAACKRGIDLKPNSSLAHDIYARFLMSRGRHEEAIAEIKTAIDLEPSSRFSQRNLGIALYYARRYPEAVVQLKRVVAMDKYFDTAYFWLSTALALQGNESEAFEWAMKLLSLRKVDEETIQAFRMAFQTSGWLGVLRERVKLVEKVGEGYFDSAAYSAQIGNKDKAFEYLEKVYQDRKMWMAYIQVDPRLDALHDDPRFIELVRRVESK
jgi:eukaryotic-like serine/threonine-protein kinase